MSRILDILLLCAALVFAAGVAELYVWAGALVGLVVLAIVFVFLMVNAPEGEDYFD